MKVEIASVDKNGYHLGTSTTNLVSIDSRGRYRWKVEHEIHDDKVVELQILRFRLKVSLVEQNECGNNISSTILVDDNYRCDGEKVRIVTIGLIFEASSIFFPKINVLLLTILKI